MVSILVSFVVGILVGMGALVVAITLFHSGNSTAVRRGTAMRTVAREIDLQAKRTACPVTAPPGR